MDSADEQSARGGHVIIKEGYNPDQYDKNLATGITAMFPGRANSIVGRSNLANVNRAAQRGYNYRLLEVCFISNRDDLNKFNSQLDEVARTILGAFGIMEQNNQPAELHNVKVFDFANDPTQHWYIRGFLMGGEEIALRNEHTWTWLSDPNASTEPVNASVWPGENDNADPKDAQKWILEATSKVGVFRLHPKVAQNLSLDVSGNNPDSNVQVQLWENNQSEAQEFMFYQITGNLYRIVSCSGMKSLAVC